MKKIWSVRFIIFVLPLFCTAYAATGDINGAIYSTDIKADINGIEVPSYNIGGRTVIICEDVFNLCYYNNDLRTLIVDWSFGGINGGQNVLSQKKNGTKTGNTYKTDIKTYIYDKNVPCYSLNGKMAVAIEDIAGNGEFNALGAKYIWNGDERTISLNIITSENFNADVCRLMKDKHVDLVVDENYNGEFKPNPFASGAVSGGIVISKDGMPREIKIDGDTVGYTFCPKRSAFYEDENKNVSLVFSDGANILYFLKDKFENLLKDVIPVIPSMEDWKEHFQNQFMTVIDLYETDDYGFYYMYQPNFHGATQLMYRIAKDGSLIDYGENFESVSLYGQKTYDNVVIDKVNQKVTFRYDKNYEIDLKTGELKAQ